MTILQPRDYIILSFLTGAVILGMAGHIWLSAASLLGALAVQDGDKT